MATIREPKRRGVSVEYRPPDDAARRLDYIMAHRVLYGSLIGSLALIALLAIGTSLWFPTFLIRTYEMTPGQVGLAYGMVMLVCGTIGTLTGGWLSGRLMRSGHADANMRIVLYATFLKGAPLIAAPLMPTATLSLAFMAVGTLIGQASQGVMLAAIQDVTPNQLRGQITAIALFFVNLVGAGLGRDRDCRDHRLRFWRQGRASLLDRDHRGGHAAADHRDAVGGHAALSSRGEQFERRPDRRLVASVSPTVLTAALQGARGLRREG